MTDKHEWLEDINGQESIDWVLKHNQRTLDTYKNHDFFNKLYDDFKTILSNQKKISIPLEITNGYVYDLWQDKSNPLGLWRRMPLEKYKQTSDEWETLLNLDELSEKEQTKWKFHYARLSPNYKKALLHLSAGGEDANTVREFDIESRSFVENGLNFSRSRGDCDWLSNDTILALRESKEDVLNGSSFPRELKKIKRGESLDEGEVLFRTSQKKPMLSFIKPKSSDDSIFYILDSLNFYEMEVYRYENDQIIKLDIPLKIGAAASNNHYLIFELCQEWKNYSLGDLIKYNLKTQEHSLLYHPKKNASIESLALANHGAYFVLNVDVISHLYYVAFDTEKVIEISLEGEGQISDLVINSDGDEFFAGISSFNKPLTYFYGERSEVKKNIASLPSYFNHESIAVEQHFATSFDKTNIPYFLVYEKSIKFDGSNPTILYGYGGFQISMTPSFDNTLGKGWLENSGVYVMANIRGGGEYGASWHQCALKENRQKSYDDFFAIAEDLISKNICSPETLGVQGGSNGGLLMGVCYTQRPDLFKAINCQVPLLDMRKYHKLSVGYLWISEYGDPDDPKDGKYISEVSPYHNVTKDNKYPSIFVNTSTKDDRVHPGHARKFIALLESFGHDCLYYENTQGGHAGSLQYKDKALVRALEYMFFAKKLSLISQ